MAEDQDDSQKTEDPTQKRLEDAVKQGQVAFSREVTTFLLLLTFTLLLGTLSPYIMRQTATTLRAFIERPETFDTHQSALGGTFLLAIQHVAKLMILPALG